jgi:signal transduction histidine kinase
MVALLVAPASALAQTSAPGKRVLLLYGHDANAPAVVAFAKGLRGEVVRSEGAERVELYEEILDFDRFPSQDWARLAGFLVHKYQAFRIDAIVAEGSLTLKFAVERIRDHFPGVPIVYGLAFEPGVDYDALPSDVTGRRQPMTFAGTLTLAKRLQPDAEQVILIGGAAPMDSGLITSAVRDITPLLGNLKLVTMQDWTYQSLLAELRKLPPRTIGILSAFSGDRRGQRFNAGDLIASVTSAASVPMYGIARNWVGDGIVGGSVMSFDDDGVRTGRLLVSVLRRSPGQPMPAAEVADAALVVDARQLERWGLSESRLPPGTEVLFRTPTIWARYWPVIFAALAIMAAESVLIASLLLERRRRIRAQQVLEDSRAQLAHIARVATLGELAAAVSHELRQPLSAIRAHASAGARLLEGAQPDLGEAREIFRDIENDDVRATEVLDHIRLLLRKEAPDNVPVDLNHICTQAIHLLNHDAGLRGIRLQLSLEPNLPLITGNAVQLQQVVLNLAMNAMDAVQASERSRRGQEEVVVGTSAAAGSVEIFVRDSGPGLSAEVQQRIFEPFYSTKSHGLGMGLAIVRSIVERHGGQVRAENHDARGAVFRVQLPVGDR